MQKSLTKKLARAGIISATYLLLSLIATPVSSGFIQVRLAEALCVLPLFFIEAVPALAVGCMLSNLITGCALPDVLLGSLVTLLAGALTFLVGRFIKRPTVRLILGGIFPVALNAFLLPFIWYYCYGKLEYLYLAQVGLLLIGQALSVYFLGSGVYFYINKLKNKNINFLN